MATADADTGDTKRECLLDLVEQKCLNFGQVQALVLDEADRMLDMGFIPDVTRIINLLPAQRQSLLFSATFSEEIKKLADRMLHNEAGVTVTPKLALQVDAVWSCVRLISETIATLPLSMFERTTAGKRETSR